MIELKHFNITFVSIGLSLCADRIVLKKIRKHKIKKKKIEQINSEHVIYLDEVFENVKQSNVTNIYPAWWIDILVEKFLL